jgi:hypothetical protein
MSLLSSELYFQVYSLNKNILFLKGLKILKVVFRLRKNNPFNKNSCFMYPICLSNLSYRNAPFGKLFGFFLYFLFPQNIKYFLFPFLNFCKHLSLSNSLQAFFHQKS